MVERRRRCGVTLVEMAILGALGTVLLLGVIGFVRSGFGASARFEAFLGLGAESRLLEATMRRDLALAKHSAAPRIEDGTSIELDLNRRATPDSTDAARVKVRYRLERDGRGVGYLMRREESGGSVRVTRMSRSPCASIHFEKLGDNSELLRVRFELTSPAGRGGRPVGLATSFLWSRLSPAASRNASGVSL